MLSPFLIPMDRFDNREYIDARVAGLDASVQGSVRTVLRYLYLSDGPTNLPRDRKKVAEPFLDLAEIVLVRWLYTRTTGKPEKNLRGSIAPRRA
jgi:hypothetical protein